MTGIPDELVEKAIDAWSHEVVHDDPYRGPMRAALEAVGLPALLERAEAINVLVQKAEKEGPFVPGEWDGRPAVLVDDLTAILGGSDD